MGNFFKDLLHQSYGERMRDEQVNPFSNPFSTEDMFSVPAEDHSDCLAQEGVFQYSLIIIEDSQWTDRRVKVDPRIDEKSKLILKTFNEMLVKIYHPNMSQNVRLLSYEKRESCNCWDFSALISSLSRVLEIELNNSIVQWIRRQKGIEMPRYYNRVKPGHNGRISDKIDLNEADREHNNELRTQTLGNIKFLMEGFQKQMPESLAIIASGLCKKWEEIREARNMSSHTSVTDEKAFLNFYKVFCMIMERGWFTTLMDLKLDLRGDNSIATA